MKMKNKTILKSLFINYYINKYIEKKNIYTQKHTY